MFIISDRNWVMGIHAALFNTFLHFTDKTIDQLIQKITDRIFNNKNNHSI